MHRIEQVPATDWQAWVTKNNATIVDVREPMEWRSTGVLPGSETISLGDLGAVLQRFDRATPLLMVCRSGNRSQTAAEFLARAGFRQVANLAGGIDRVAAA